jgi:dihydrofolate reductase
MTAKLVYSAIASLDGYIEDEDGKFDWAAPDDEVHAFVNDLERPVGTYLYGRRMYETMAFWSTRVLWVCRFSGRHDRRSRQTALITGAACQACPTGFDDRRGYLLGRQEPQGLP